MTIRKSLVLALGSLALAACQSATDSSEQAANTNGADTSAASTSFTVDVSYHTLDNGLRVVLSEDHTDRKSVV